MTLEELSKVEIYADKDGNLYVVKDKCIYDINSEKEYGNNLFAHIPVRFGKRICGIVEESKEDD